MPPSPEVVSGLRQPRSVRLEAIRAQSTEVGSDAQVAQALLTSTPEVTVYVSKYRGYMVQVTAPRNYSDPSTGRKIFGGETLVARFEEGVYRNKHRDPATRKLIDEALQSNPYFGAFGSNAHFWLASDQQSRTEAARVKSALDTLKSLPPEVVEKYVAALKQGDAADHELPSVETAGPKPGIRPIPPAQ